MNKKASSNRAYLATVLRTSAQIYDRLTSFIEGTIMPYTAFYEKFQEIAEKENRKATSIKSDKRVKIRRK